MLCHWLPPPPCSSHCIPLSLSLFLTLHFSLASQVLLGSYLASVAGLASAVGGALPAGGGGERGVWVIFDVQVLSRVFRRHGRAGIVVDRALHRHGRPRVEMRRRRATTPPRRDPGWSQSALGGELLAWAGKFRLSCARAGSREGARIRSIGRRVARVGGGGDSRLLGARAPSDEKSLTSLAKFPALCCRSLLPTTDESHSQSTGDIPGRSSFIPLAYRLAYWYAVCEVLLSFSPLTSFIPVRHAVLE